MLKFSLIATVFNDAEGTRKFARRMNEQTRKPDEIIILDAGSTDGTWKVLEEFANSGTIALKLLRKESCKPAPSRNLCAKAATYDILAVTDIGCDWEPQWFEELVAPMEADPTLDAVMGSWRVAWEDQKTPWAKADYFLQPTIILEATPATLAANRAIAYKKNFYLSLGGLPEDLTFAGDDLLLAYQIVRSGRRIGAAPTPRCTWERPQTFAALFKESCRYGRGSAELGISLRNFILVSGRLGVEALMFILSILFLLVGKPLAGVTCLVLMTLLVFFRLVKLDRRKKRRAQEGREASIWNLAILDYTTKIAIARGFIEGFYYGRLHCLDSRRKARSVGLGFW